MKHLPLFISAVAATMFGSAFAYTVSGSVSDENGQAIKDASVTLVKENKSTKTDEAGKFTIHEDEAEIPPIGIQASAVKPGYISINSGILSYSQSGNAPVQVRIFDAVGHQVLNQTLYGAGEVDLRTGTNAMGSYYAQVTMGSAKQNIRFTTNGSYATSFDAQGHALLKEIQQGETLQFVAEGFDTLSVPLGTLDTTVNVKLVKTAPAEETFAFGYALKNEPRPSKGCGKNSTLNSTGSVENGKKFNLNVGGKNRTFFMTLPKNYDNTKPHKLLIANHCMGSKAEDFVHHAPDYDHDEMITAMFDNYCVDTTRVFATGFSFGAMFTNSLAQDMQERLRAVAVYAVADYNIWLPSAGTGRYDAKDLPIAWMLVHGKGDGTCDYNRAKNSALPRILRRNGKADANGKFTDASAEKPKEINSNTAGHVCYDFTTVDPRFPVKFCSWNGPHRWPAHDEGDYSNYNSNSWSKSWVPQTVHEFFEQF